MHSFASAPVALFFFNRPSLTAQVFARIREARPARLFLIADGPRASHPDDRQQCEAARAVVDAIDWPCDVSTNFAAENLGCRRRLSSGLDWVFAQVPEAIVLEDDCVPNASFFRFCTDMLERYRDDSRIMHIGGSNFQDGRQRGAASYFFSRYTFTWGWATWRRAWRYYDADLALWPRVAREKLLAPLLHDPLEIAYWSALFGGVFNRTIDTWDYQWTLACWMQHGLSIVPNRNLVTNIGAGPDALHFTSDHSTIGVPTIEMHDLRHPDVCIRDVAADTFVFDEHIAGRERRMRSTWHGRLRCVLAPRTRLRLAIERLRSMPGVKSTAGWVVFASNFCL